MRQFKQNYTTETNLIEVNKRKNLRIAEQRNILVELKIFRFQQIFTLVAKFYCKILFIYKHSSKADYIKGEWCVFEGVRL